MVLKLRNLGISLNESQFRVETRETWLIEVRLYKGHVVMELSSSQIVFGNLGSFFGLLLGSTLWQLGPLGFNFFH